MNNNYQLKKYGVWSSANYFTPVLVYESDSRNDCEQYIDTTINQNVEEGLRLSESEGFIYNEAQARAEYEDMFTIYED